MSTLRYRVHPTRERARVFGHLNNARIFAESAFSRQGLTDLSSVVICQGSGTDFRTVGTYGLVGSCIRWTWHDADKAEERAAVAFGESETERLRDQAAQAARRGLIETAETLSMMALAIENGESSRRAQRGTR